MIALFQLFLGAVGALDDRVVKLCGEGSAKFGNIFGAKCGLLGLSASVNPSGVRDFLASALMRSTFSFIMKYSLSDQLP